jgi:UDP-N-acetylmuramoylalanine--D-glutamate ligase
MGDDLDLLDLGGRDVLVCGARFAGQAAARALLARGARVQVTDRGAPDGAAELRHAGARLIGAVDDLPAGVSLVVTSPGWHPGHPVLAAARRRGVEVLGEVEFAWRLRGPNAAPWLMVTGTNGKTTTVRMVESILQAAGRRALAVGNVGVSVIDAVLANRAYDVLAVEVSSFQLYWSSTIVPAAGALLNLAPDHLDWHGSMAAYAAAKTRVWRSDTAIANADDPAVMELFAAASAPSRLAFGLGPPAAGQPFGIRGGLLVHDDAELLPAAEVRPAGPHNLANALAAAALTTGIAGPDAVAQGLRAFVPDPHRNAVVATVHGVRYVDDSKATNGHAARASLAAYDRVVWIAGGQLKGASVDDVDDLVAEVRPKLAGAVLLGVDRVQLADALRRHAPDVPVIVVEADDDEAMLDVVRSAAELARPGDTVLLAPAAASYDMFANYAARGRAFADAVRELPA